MANDRMFLHNTISHKKFLLAKHLETNWYIPGKIPGKIPGDFDQRLESFFEECEREFYEDPHAWEILFESDCLYDDCKASHIPYSEEDKNKLKALGIGGKSRNNI